jgi:LacI family transcriptional regulator
MKRLRKKAHSGGSDPTLRDVAQAAGVSLMTVSNVVNGRFESMSEETRKRVEQAIASLNYRPSATARGLRLERNFTIGMLIADTSAGFLADPFISQVVAGASRYLDEKGYGCLVHGVRPEEFENSIFLRFARTDGLCVFLTGTHAMRRSMMARLRRLGEPIVAIQEIEPDRAEDICVVRQDDQGGAMALAEHLVAGGAQTIAFLAPRMTWPAIIQRAKAVRDVLARQGNKKHFHIVRCGNGSIDEARLAFSRYLDRSGPPSGIIAATDRLSIAASSVLETYGLSRIPLAGFRAVDFLRTAKPTLTAVSSAFEIGLKSAEALVKRIERGAFEEAEIVLPMRIEIPGDTQP